MYSLVVNYHFPPEDTTAASQKSSTVMPRFRHSMCVYWTAASLIVFILTSRMFIEQRAVDRLHSTPTSLFPVHGGKETKRTDEYSDIRHRRLKAGWYNATFDSEHLRETDAVEQCAQAYRLDSLRRHCSSTRAGNASEHASGGNETATSERRPSYDFLLVDDVHKVIYCAIPKAASTTWKSLMARASGHLLTESMTEHQVEDAAFLRSVGLRFLNTFTESQVAVRLAYYFKFAVVRHPLTRLVSAYRDKVARFNSYGVDVRRRIAESSPSNVSSESQSAKNHSNRFQRITFQQFARYVIKEANSDRFDHHWSPYERLCHFCHVKYDYVAKLETMEADAYRLVSHLGLDHKDKAGARHRIPLFNSRQRPLATTSNKTASTRPLASDGLRSQLLTEFNTLTADEIDRLGDIYASDMNMFGYGWTSSQLLATCQNTTATARSRTCC